MNEYLTHKLEAAGAELAAAEDFNNHLVAAVRDLREALSTINVRAQAAMQHVARGVPFVAGLEAISIHQTAMDALSLTEEFKTL